MPETGRHCTFYPADVRNCLPFREPVPVPSDLLLKAKKAQNVLYAPAPHAHTELRGLNVCPYAHLQNSEAKARTGRQVTYVRLIT